MGAGQKETEQEKEPKENCQTCIFNSSYHFQIPLTLSLNHSALSNFLLSDSASLLAVTDASSLLFVLAFFNVIFLVFVSGQCLCSREFSTSNLRLHDIHFSMFLCVSRRRCFIARPSALFLICTPSLKHKILETAAAQSSVFLNLPVKQHVRSQQGQ